MYTAKHAIIMAAGKGERLHPVTLDTPKPLVKVNGVRMIETSIEALHANGIYDIHIVTGYKSEQFSVLKEKYPEIHFIYNQYYADYNNISSMYVARDTLTLGDCIILDGDLVISNPEILSPEFERTGYNGIWTEEDTVEWLMQIDETGTMTSCSRTGGNKGWILLGISRWTAEDALKLKKYVEYEFEEARNRQLYWDDVAIFQHFDKFSFGYREMKRSDVVEIDDYSDLVVIDPSYVDYQPKSV